MSIDANALRVLRLERECAPDADRARAYAAVLKVNDARVFDADPATPLFPLYCTCIEWANLNASEWSEALGAEAEDANHAVHAFTDIHFYETLKPASLLVARTGASSVQKTRAGALVVAQTDIHDTTTGALLIRSINGSMWRGVEIRGAAFGAFERFVSSSPAQETGIDVSVCPTLPYVYAGCADIWRPIHTDRRAAQLAGFGDVILHGSATLALAASRLIEAKGLCWRSVRRLRGAFRAPVFGGAKQTLHLSGSSNEIEFRLVNTQGVETLDCGLLKIDRMS